MFKTGEIVRSGLFSLAIPLSAFTDPFGVVNSIYFSRPVIATNYNWEDGDHFQHTNAPLYSIYTWYNEVFKDLKQ